MTTAAESVGPSRNGCIMTKNRARKQAARQRAALTGERYVVAQRAAAEPPRTSRMHDLMHRLPGMPPHLDGGLQRSAKPDRRAGRNPYRTRRHAEPGVLVAWQNWITRRVGAGTH